MLGEPSGKFDFYVLYRDDNPQPSPPPESCKPQPPPSKPELQKSPAFSPYYQTALKQLAKSPAKKPMVPSKHSSQPIPCYMFNPSSSGYSDDFPPLDDFENTQQRTKHVWKVKTPTATDAQGQQKSVSPAEATLNWQSENAVAQNQVLSSIARSQNRLETHVSTLDANIQELKGKIQELHVELLHIADTVKDISVATQAIVQKEKEKRHLEAQLVDLEKQQEASKQESAQPLFSPFSQTQSTGMAELWPSVSKRILPRSFKQQSLAVPHGSPFVRQPVQTTPTRPSPPPKPTPPKPPSDPTVGASSTQP